jgi:hypothetical protein
LDARLQQPGTLVERLGAFLDEFTLRRRDPGTRAESWLES